MKVRVKHAGLPAKIRIDEQILEIADGSTLLELLKLIAHSQEDESAKRLIIQDGPQTACIVLRNGRLHRDLEATLVDGDEICLLLPLAGG